MTTDREIDILRISTKQLPKTVQTILSVRVEVSVTLNNVKIHFFMEVLTENPLI